jgi:hypothetical protein
VQSRTAAAGQTTGEVLQKGNPIGSNQYKRNEEMPQLGISSQSQKSRAKANGVGRDTQQRLDWLARHAPEQLERVKRGEVSAHRACIEAGRMKPLTPLQGLKRASAFLSIAPLSLTTSA